MSGTGVQKILSCDLNRFLKISGLRSIFGVETLFATLVWNHISAEKSKNRSDLTEPLETPTMAGGLFSIEKDYFYEIGSYDTGMDIWVSHSSPLIEFS